MKFSDEIYEELNAISPLLAGIGKKNIFSVPEGYFDELTVNTLKRVDTGDLKTALTVPEGYFEGLAISVLRKIKSLEDDPAVELRTLSPMLYSIQNENVFEVPRGYFNHLQNDILDKVITKPAKVVELKKKDSIWKYAVAAVVTGIIGVSSLMMFNTQQTVSSNEASTFQQIDKAIASLSEDEIIKYLETTGTDVDNEALAAGIDASALPEAKDYMLDENALETYLNDTEKNSQN